VWDNIYECVYCYNRCHGNVFKGFSAFRDNIYDCVRLALHVAAGVISLVFHHGLIYVAKSARQFAPSFNLVSEQL
jgi:hypothetical protein